MDVIKLQEIRTLLDARVAQYNQPAFITKDPISVPHQFSQLQDVEISALFAALLAWGQRPTILKKAAELMQRMDNAPYQFITQHADEDLKRLLKFCHRTFCDTDLLYFVHWLRWFYGEHQSLEDARDPGGGPAVPGAPGSRWKRGTRLGTAAARKRTTDAPLRR